MPEEFLINLKAICLQWVEPGEIFYALKEASVLETQKRDQQPG